MLPRPSPLEKKSEPANRRPEKLPVDNPHVGTFHHSGIPPFNPTYLYYAAHSPYLPLFRHSAPTAPIARLIYNMMRGEHAECRGEEDWVVVNEKADEEADEKADEEEAERVTNERRSCE